MNSLTQVGDKIEFKWEELREEIRRMDQKYSVLSAPFPPVHIPQIITNQTSGIEYPRCNGLFKERND